MPAAMLRKRRKKKEERRNVRLKPNAIKTTNYWFFCLNNFSYRKQCAGAQNKK